VIFAGTTSYQYDDLNRLTRIERANGAIILYNYDELGNRISKLVTHGTILTAHFSCSPTIGTAPLTVSFTDQSIGNITSWLWDFGDGNTSTEQHPVHTFGPGKHTVSLTVATDSQETDTKVWADLINAATDIINESIYDDFEGSVIDQSKWTIDDPDGILGQSNGNLTAASPSGAQYASLESKQVFRGDFEFVLAYSNFYSTSYLPQKTEVFPGIRLIAKFVSSDAQIALKRAHDYRYQDTSRGMFISQEFIGGAEATGTVGTSAVNPTGLLKIQRTGSTIITAFNDRAGWVSLGTYENSFVDDVIIHIGIEPGFNGDFHVLIDGIYYSADTQPDKGNGPSLKIPDTGQTVSYTDTFGEDSDYIINPKSFTKLDENGNALPESAASWAMVRDNVTGLTWENKTVDAGIHDRNHTHTWQEAQDVFIAQLNASGFGGFNDWRLPTIKELSMLFHGDKADPTIDTFFFPNTVSAYYWSLDSHSDITSLAWGMYFHNGLIEGRDKLDTHHLRAVRGGQPGLSGDYATNGDGTVTDLNTGLMWQQQAPPEMMTWEEALNYCESLSLAGKSDWRLPNRNELQSLVDYSKNSPALNPLFTPEWQPPHYWSSTTHARFNTHAWGVYFYSGFISYNTKTNTYYVRAVRTAQPDPDILTHSGSGTSFTGQWTLVAAPGAFQDESLVTQEDGATFTFDPDHTGCRTVSLWWSQDPGHHDAVPVEIYDDITLLDTVYVNQQTGGGQWQELGTYFFNHSAVVVVISDSATHTTSVDAVQTTATDDCHNVSRVLVPGWNLLTPVHQTAVPMIASLWAAGMDSQGAQITRVQKWDGTGWQSFSPGNPFGDFAIEPGRGYFVFNQGQSQTTWESTGMPVPCPMTYEFSAGWNLMGFPSGVHATSSELAESINAQQDHVTRIQKWDGSGWQSYSPDAPFGSFDITHCQGYFLFSSQTQASYTQACEN
jgi:YD repeat-containing protein